VKIQDVVDTVGGRIVCGDAGSGGVADDEVEYGFSSDLMSDVLTITADGVLLITGLSAIQTIRTAIVADISHILFVRNKRATDDMITLAAENGMLLIECAISMFNASALLHARGLKPVY